MSIKQYNALSTLFAELFDDNGTIHQHFIGKFQLCLKEIRYLAQQRDVFGIYAKCQILKIFHPHDFDDINYARHPDELSELVNSLAATIQLISHDTKIPRHIPLCYKFYLLGHYAEAQHDYQNAEEYYARSFREFEKITAKQYCYAEIMSDLLWRKLEAQALCHDKDQEQQRQSTLENFQELYNNHTHSEDARRGVLLMKAEIAMAKGENQNLDKAGKYLEKAAQLDKAHPRTILKKLTHLLLDQSNDRALNHVIKHSCELATDYQAYKRQANNIKNAAFRKLVRSICTHLEQGLKRHSHNKDLKPLVSAVKEALEHNNNFKNACKIGKAFHIGENMVENHAHSLMSLIKPNISSYHMNSIINKMIDEEVSKSVELHSHHREAAVPLKQKTDLQLAKSALNKITNLMKNVEVDPASSPSTSRSQILDNQDKSISRG